MLIAHLTDTHLGLPPGIFAEHIDPPAALRRALVHVRNLQPAPDVVLLTGDLTDNSHARDFELLVHLFDEELPGHRRGQPRVLVTAGNHDKPEMMRRLLPAAWTPPLPGEPPERMSVYAAIGGLHFIGLDTSVPNFPHGNLSAAQLGNLDALLQTLAGQPVVLFMHHPPLVTGMAVMDRYGLRQGSQPLAEIVQRHGQVKLICAGHFHRPITSILGGAQVVVAPSVSHQLSLDLRPEAGLSLQFEPPMIGLYRWSEELGMVCHLSYVHDFGGPQVLHM